MSEHEPNEHTSGANAGRQALTHLSLSNVLWILITVVSIASFIFSYDTRITVLENQASDIPTIQERVSTLRDKVKSLESQLETTELQLNELQNTADSNVVKVSNINAQVRELEFRIKSLKQQIERLQQVID